MVLLGNFCAMEAVDARATRPTVISVLSVANIGVINGHFRIEMREIRLAMLR